MSETTVVRHPLSRRARKAGGHVQNIEDRYSTGVPDTNLCLNGYEAWVECKWLPGWPKRPTTKVRVKFRPGQIPWLASRAKAGGNAYVLLGVGTGRGADIMLFRGSDVTLLDGELTTFEVRSMPVAVGWEAVLWALGGD